jgi:hypothetical protein
MLLQQLHGCCFISSWHCLWWWRNGPVAAASQGAGCYSCSITVAELGVYTVARLGPLCKPQQICTQWQWQHLSRLLRWWRCSSDLHTMKTALDGCTNDRRVHTRMPCARTHTHTHAHRVHARTPCGGCAHRVRERTPCARTHTVCTHAHTHTRTPCARAHAMWWLRLNSDLCTTATALVVALKQRPVHHGDLSGSMHAPTPCAHKHAAVCAHASRTPWARTQCARTPSECMHGVAFWVHARTHAVCTHASSARKQWERMHVIHGVRTHACCVHARTPCSRTHACHVQTRLLSHDAEPAVHHGDGAG